MSQTTDSLSEQSDLAFIELNSEDPIDVFKEWQSEALKFSPGSVGAFCLATISKNSKVTARNLKLRRLDNDGFVMITDGRSDKAHVMANEPSAAMCFLWNYQNNKKQNILRQVRVEGTLVKLPREDIVDIYEAEPLFCKIRSHICHQNKEVDWNTLKDRHDQVLESVRNGHNKLPMPEHVAGYKMKPDKLEFYFGRDHMIADRIVFTREAPISIWRHTRVAA